MSRWQFEPCTSCKTGEVCGSRGYQPARNVSDATMTAALEAGTDRVVTRCERTDCAPLVCDGRCADFLQCPNCGPAPVSPSPVDGPEAT